MFNIMESKLIFSSRRLQRRGKHDSWSTFMRSDKKYMFHFNTSSWQDTSHILTIKLQYFKFWASNV